MPGTTYNQQPGRTFRGLDRVGQSTQRAGTSRARRAPGQRISTCVPCARSGTPTTPDSLARLGGSTGSEGKITVLLADDHAMVREGLRLIIDAQSDMKVVGCASCGREAVEATLTLKPMVLVMDLSMPELNGLQAAEMLRDSGAAARILILTVHEDESYLREVLRASVAGYVLKRAGSTELLEAIRKVATGGVHFDRTLSSRILQTQFNRPGDRPDWSGLELSPREKRVLLLLAWGHTTKEVGAQLGVSGKTVETYKTRVARKLSLRTRVDFVRYALRRGWLRET